MAKGKRIDKLSVYKIMLKMFECDNLTETSKELKIPITTVSTIYKRNKDKKEFVSLRKKQERNFVEKADSIINKATDLLESVKKKNSLFRRLRINGLRSIEDDLYEYRVRAKNAKTEDEAMYTLRQINTRLAILDDYIKYEDLDDSERDKYVDVINQFRDIREYLSTKKIYNRKNYGIWYDYDQLDKDTAE